MKVAILFAGLGGISLGYQRAGFTVVGAIDNDPAACRDHETLTGVPATCADLATMSPADLRAACGGVRPDVLATSPPCRGFSACLPRSLGKTEKYQNLNNLALRGIWIALEAWEVPPPLIVIRNGRGLVPDARSHIKEILMKNYCPTCKAEQSYAVVRYQTEITAGCYLDGDTWDGCDDPKEDHNMKVILSVACNECGTELKSAPVESPPEGSPWIPLDDVIHDLTANHGGGNVIFRPGEGFHPNPDIRIKMAGKFIFELPSGDEFMTISPTGQVTVRGEVVAERTDIFQAFALWMHKSNIIHAEVEGEVR